MKWLFIIFITLIMPIQAIAQDTSFDIETHINNIIRQGDETENQSYYDLLLYYYDNPIDINKTSEQELSLLGMLSVEQIAELLAHINKTGEFMGINELQVLSSFSL